MPPLNRWTPTLLLPPTTLGTMASAAVQAQPPHPASQIPVTDFGALFNEAFFLKLGFSFIVGLAVGYALKFTFKIVLAMIGLFLIGLFALQYAGMAHVDWSGMEVRYDTWAAWLSVNGPAFLDFIGSNLSNTASFLAGLAMGLKI